MAGKDRFSRYILYKFCKAVLRDRYLWMIFRLRKRTAAKVRRYNLRYAFLPVSMSGFMPKLSIKTLHSDIKNRSRSDSAAQRLKSCFSAVWVQAGRQKAGYRGMKKNCRTRKKNGLKIKAAE